MHISEMFRFHLHRDEPIAHREGCLDFRVFFGRRVDDSVEGRPQGPEGSVSSRKPTTAPGQSTSEARTRFPLERSRTFNGRKRKQSRMELSLRLSNTRTRAEETKGSSSKQPLRMKLVWVVEKAKRVDETMHE